MFGLLHLGIGQRKCVFNLAPFEEWEQGRKPGFC